MYLSPSAATTVISNPQFVAMTEMSHSFFSTVGLLFFRRITDVFSCYKITSELAPGALVPAKGLQGLCEVGPGLPCAEQGLFQLAPRVKTTAHNKTQRHSEQTKPHI